MSALAKYLVQDDKGVLHAYWTREILLCDMAQMSAPAAIYRLCTRGMTTRYLPTTEQELRELSRVGLEVPSKEHTAAMNEERDMERRARE